MAASEAASETVAFEVAGVPQPQGSKTVARASSGRSFVREDNPKLEPWRTSVAAAAAEAMKTTDGRREPLTGPLRLEATFVFPRPQSHYRTGSHAGELRPSAPMHCAKRPDLDKLLRAIGDAVTGIIVVDDASFAEVAAAKHYGTPACYVTVRRVE